MGPAETALREVLSGPGCTPDEAQRMGVSEGAHFLRLKRRGALALLTDGRYRLREHLASPAVQELIERRRRNEAEAALRAAESVAAREALERREAERRALLDEVAAASTPEARRLIVEGQRAQALAERVSARLERDPQMWTDEQLEELFGIEIDRGARAA